MNRKLRNLRFFLGVFLLSTSCYDDIGNYEYHDINDMEVKDMSRIYSVRIPKKDSTLVVVNPYITQTQTEGNENLEYEWRKQVGREWVVCGNELSYGFYIYPTDSKDIYLRFMVRDKEQNIETYQETTIHLVYAFAQCWFVLQEIDGNAVLGAVDGAGKVRVVAQDVYKQETGMSLEGKPLFLAANNSHHYGKIDDFTFGPLLGVYTRDGFNGMLEPSTLEEKYAYDRMLLHKKLQGDKNFKPEFAAGSKGGECVIDAGKFWYAFGDGYSIYYPVKASDAVGEYEAGMACMEYIRGLHIIWDKRGKRFLKYQNSEYGMVWVKHKNIDENANYALYDVNDPRANAQKIEFVGENPGYPNVFDPEDIQGDKIIYMGPMSERDDFLLLAVSQAGPILYGYEFNLPAMAGYVKKQPYCSGRFEINPRKPAGAKDKFIIASSGDFKRMFFYACGNTIYRVDLTRAIPFATEIYQVPENAEIIGLKFCSPAHDSGYLAEDAVNDDDWTLYNYPSKLGAVVRRGAEDSLIEMELNAAGDIKLDENRLPVVYEFKGFKNTVDFVFSFR